MWVAVGWQCPAVGADRPKKMREPDSVYVGTAHDLIWKMMQMADLKKSDVVYDLGCGDGRIVVLAAKFYGCRGAGYDIDPDRVSESRENVKKHGVGQLVTIEQEDIFKVDLKPASALLLYLLPAMNVKLIPQFEQLRPGSRIVAHDYGIAGIRPDQVVSFTSQEDNARHTLYLYTTPLKKTAE
jgi:ribosomal protein L11 methylase PrmA